MPDGAQGGADDPDRVLLECVEQAADEDQGNDLLMGGGDADPGEGGFEFPDGGAVGCRWFDMRTGHGAPLFCACGAGSQTMCQFRTNGQIALTIGLGMGALKDEILQIRPRRGRRAAPVVVNVEEKILDAAEFVFGYFGLRGATTALIAKKAGVGKAHIYYYFEDKEDLYCAILERAMKEWARDIDDLDTDADLRSVLRDYIHRKVDFSRDHPSLSRIYANEIINGAPFIGKFIEKVSTPQLLAKVAMVEAWTAQGLIKPVSAVDLFFCIWAMTQAYADFASQMTIMKKKRRLEEADYDAAKATIVQLVFGGLGLKNN